MFYCHSVLKVGSIINKDNKNRKILHWLRNDQRIQDHSIFSNLNLFSSTSVFYLKSDKYNDQHFLGFDYINEKRKAFLEQSLKEMKQKLADRGIELIIINSIGELKKLNLKADVLTYQKLYGTEELEEEEKILSIFSFEKMKIQDFTLANTEKLPFTLHQLPQVFTSFRKKIEKYGNYNEPVTLPPLPQNSFPYKMRGGESQALNRIKHYFDESKNLATYKETRNGMVGTDYSSRLSPWLALGNISASTIFKYIEDFEEIYISNSSTYWLKFELLWRDFFQLQLQLHGSLFFRAGGVQQKEAKFLRNTKVFWKWANGETGDDLVDANMKELNCTGWMSNRGRQNVASYLIHDMRVHWRWGAAYLESQLVDYDPASNWGNWMYIAGVGHDPRPFRKFNTVGQAERYDPDRTYRDLWLK